MLSHLTSSRVIKAADRRGGPTVASLNLDDVADQAREYLEQVRAEGAKLVAQAESEAAAIRARAEQEGRAAALAANEQSVSQRVAAQMQAALPVVRAVVEEFQQAQRACRAQWEERMVHLACAMAERIIRRELRAAPDITVDLVREAVQMAAGSPQLRIELNPDDYRVLAREVESLVAECARGGRAEIIAARHIGRGGCRIETQLGSIDQQIETQLARLKEELS